MRKAKIVATLGPSSQTIEVISELIQAGLNAVRLNMSHGTHEDHLKTLNNVREASRRMSKEVAILADLQGPKIRVDKLAKPLSLIKHDKWYVGVTNNHNFENFIPSTYADIIKDSKVDTRILFDDGLIESTVQEKGEDYLKIRIDHGGELKSNKGINLPDVYVSAPSLTEKDKEDALFAVENKADYLALSFVKTARDVGELKSFLNEYGKSVPVVAKIERHEAVADIENIIDVADAIMVARGDMAVELGNHRVPLIQKEIIHACNLKGRPVITATQMLESMIENSRPTRAEATDVANAIWDGTDAVMLSGETATGKHPVKVIEEMDTIVREAEKKPKVRPFLRDVDLSGLTSALQASASLMAEKTDAKCLLVISESGKSCCQMSQFRPRKRVFGVTNKIESHRRMSLYWGIEPILYTGNMVSLEEQALRLVMNEEKLKKGDKVIFARGGWDVYPQELQYSVQVRRVT